MFAESHGFPEKIDVNPTDDIFLEGVEKSSEVVACMVRCVIRTFISSVD